MNLGFNGDLNGANQQLKTQICDLSPVILVSFSQLPWMEGFSRTVSHPFPDKASYCETDHPWGIVEARYWWSGALLFDLGRHNWCALGDDEAHHFFMVPVPQMVSSLFLWWLNTCGKKWWLPSGCVEFWDGRIDHGSAWPLRASWFCSVFVLKWEWGMSFFYWSWLRRVDWW